MMKILGTLIVLLGVASSAFGLTAVPEVDANSSVAAIALVSGGLLVIRARRRK